MSDNKIVDERRRGFLKAMSAAGLLVGVGGSAYVVRDDKMYIANAEGALVIDLKKCMGCMSCMHACSISHHGEASLSLARIQIQQDSFTSFPNDIQMATCHQCDDAPCVGACPVNANLPNGEFGNVRDIDPAQCIGCMQCIEACPYTPKRVQWNPTTRKAQKCDLCVNTPFMDAAGGPKGTKACQTVCPVGAIGFVTELPDQKTAPDSYVINLRNEHWAKLGRTIED